MVKNLKKPLLVFLIALLALLFDQGSKWYISHIFTPLQKDPLVGLTFQKNYFVAFSIPINGFIFSLGAFFLLVILLCFSYKKIFKHNFYTWSVFALIFTGAIGNLLDRCFYGYVVDFIKVFTFPVFNLADSYITVGVIVSFLFYKRIFREEK